MRFYRTHLSISWIQFRAGNVASLLRFFNIYSNKVALDLYFKKAQRRTDQFWKYTLFFKFNTPDRHTIRIVFVIRTMDRRERFLWEIEKNGCYVWPSSTGRYKTVIFRRIIRTTRTQLSHENPWRNDPGIFLKHSLYIVPNVMHRRYKSTVANFFLYFIFSPFFNGLWPNSWSELTTLFKIACSHFRETFHG